MFDLPANDKREQQQLYVDSLWCGRGYLGGYCCLLLGSLVFFFESDFAAPLQDEDGWKPGGHRHATEVCRVR